MKKHAITTALVTLLLAACGSSDTDVTGRYELDQGSFAQALADKLIDLGKVPAEARDQAIQQLKSSRFSLDLAADGSFTATQKILTESRDYIGTWTMVGNQIRLDQTHEDGKEVTDEMAGSLVAGTMILTHNDKDTGEFTMTLRHQPAATPK